MFEANPNDPDSTPPAKPVVIKQRRGCLATLLGSLFTIIISAALGAALALAAIWYGPQYLGLKFSDSSGRVEQLELAERTAVIERTELKSTLRSYDDLTGSVATLKDEVQALESAQNTREVDLDALQQQIDSNLASLLALQKRLDELESIPANAALAQRIADAENDLATVKATLDRLRQAFGVPSAATSTPTVEPTSTLEPTSTPVPTATP